MVNKKLPKILDQREFELLFKANTKQLAEAKGKKKKTIREFRLCMILGFEAGMRISEIVGYKRKDGTTINPLTKEQFEGNQIRIIDGKGRRIELFLNLKDLMKL